MHKWPLCIIGAYFSPSAYLMKGDDWMSVTYWYDQNLDSNQSWSQAPMSALHTHKHTKMDEQVHSPFPFVIIHFPFVATTAVLFTWHICFTLQFFLYQLWKAYAVPAF